MDVLFQDAGNTAVLVAENKTRKALLSSDVIMLKIKFRVLKAQVQVLS
jgi:hypothetical protein